MTIRTIIKLWFIILIGCISSVVAAQNHAENLPDNGAYLSWNVSEPYWFNRHIGIAVEQSNTYYHTDPIPNHVTKTNFVVGTKLFSRLTLTGNAGYLSWPSTGVALVEVNDDKKLYWGLSTQWQFNQRISFKAQWQQINLEQKEQLLLMGVDIKLSF